LCKNKKCFALLELIIAIAIFTTTLSACVVSFFVASRSIESEIEEYNCLWKARGLIEEYIAGNTNTFTNIADNGEVYYSSLSAISIANNGTLVESSVRSISNVVVNIYYESYTSSFN